MKARTKDGRPWFREPREVRDEEVERLVAETWCVEDGRAELEAQRGLGPVWQCRMGTVVD